MSPSITHIQGERHAALGNEANSSFDLWEESLLLDVPSEEPPLAQTRELVSKASLANAIERTNVSLSGQVIIDPQSSTATILAPNLDRNADRDQFLHELMVLRDTHPAIRHWKVDLSSASKVPLLVLGALRQYHSVLALQGGGVTVSLGERHPTEASLEKMIRRMFDVALNNGSSTESVVTLGSSPTTSH